MKNLIINSEQDMMAFGKRLAELLKPGDILCLVGDLGAGKTTMVKGLAQGLKIDPDDICSPTFILMNAYERARIPLYHFDLYRLGDIADIHALGYEDFLYGEGMSVIEWADRFGPLMPDEHLLIQIEHKGETKRLVKVVGHGQRYVDLVKKFNN